MIGRATISFSRNITASPLYAGGTLFQSSGTLALLLFVVLLRTCNRQRLIMSVVKPSIPTGSHAYNHGQAPQVIVIAENKLSLRSSQKVTTLRTVRHHRFLPISYLQAAAPVAVTSNYLASTGQVYLAWTLSDNVISYPSLHIMYSSGSTDRLSKEIIATGGNCEILQFHINEIRW